jgi:imidazolonepropionase-like amidohydrolase
VSALHVHGVRVPDGAPIEWWVEDGVLRDAPVAGATDMPGGWIAEGGLVDAHVHLSFEPHTVFGHPRGSDELIAAALGAHRSAGELVVRDAGAVPGADPAAVAGDGVVVVGCGPPLAPAGGFIAALHEPVAPAIAAEAAAGVIRSGRPWAKVILDFFGPDGNPLTARLGYEPAVLAEIAAAVHEAGGRLAVHVIAAHVEIAIEAGADSIEHGNTADADLVRELAARGIAWTPTLGTVAERYLERHARAAPPVRALLDRQRETLPLAAELGVTVLAGTDEEPHGSVAHEVAVLMRYGLPAPAAVAAVTTTAHAFLGTAVRAGDRARLVTFDADPVLDPGVLARPVAVIA